MQSARRMATTRPSYIRDILKATQGRQILSLAGGLPDAQLFPTGLLARAAHELAETPGVYQYGLTSGLPGLVDHIATQNNLASPDQLLITTGSQQGLDLISRAYLNPGDRILAEAPVYLGALQIFQLAEIDIGLIPATDTGPDIAQLEAELAKGGVKFFYAVPDFHNPTGVCWSLATRLAVAELLDRYKVMLIEDAPYRQLRYRGDELPLVSALMKGEHLLLQSFSKIATPGMRIGYVQGSAELLSPLVVVKQASDLHSSLPMQQMILSLLKAPEFPQHLSNLRHHYGLRVQVLAEALQHELGSALSFDVPQGGMFIWARLTEDEAPALAQRCLRNGLAVVPGQAFWPEGAPGYEAIRLNFSCLAPAQLKRAAQRLAASMSESSTD
ncbi:PLP-dependent aminotransferase family protein [Reinekea marinisedimentorum]|uniref:DNA-binding transcriptional MocR family regulator n=1 Tax=Reinekea marinisedimentorum TaxID=230495 RepID=A0A4R3IFP1_9GAMM|nr:PLP-dependent aminotransferase family protein [Reinekea marinisedimentorum]TCS43802.1 DNA-binding transcriptional MocR family regulator [Reinekea marinisedimentorum]